MTYDFFPEYQMVYLRFFDHYHSEDFINALKTVMDDPNYSKGLTAIIDLTNKKGSYLGFNIQLVVDFVKDTDNLPSTTYFISNNPILTAFGYLAKKRIQKKMKLDIYSSVSSVQKSLKTEGITITNEDIERLRNQIELHT